jgi:xanthosine utilization system XapX-like protein
MTYIIADGVSVGEVSAFIGPLIAAIGLVGGLVAWVISRTSKYVKTEITNVQSVTNERIATLTQQLVTQSQALQQVQRQTQDTATSVARIEGRLSAESPHKPAT